MTHGQHTPRFASLCEEVAVLPNRSARHKRLRLDRAALAVQEIVVERPRVQKLKPSFNPRRIAPSDTIDT